MKILSVKEMQKIDKMAIEEFGIPALILMENAGRGVANEASKMILRKISNDTKENNIDNKTKLKISIFCGGGNNGGDGLVTGRYLYNQGFEIKIIILKPKQNYSYENTVNLKILENLGIEIIEYKNISNLEKSDKIIEHSVLLIDALLGTGFKPPVSGEMETLINFLNNSKIPILSIDIPSGLDGDTGIPQNIAIKASITVTLGFIKKGFFENEGKSYTGDLIVCDIGFPRILADKL